MQIVTFFSPCRAAGKTTAVAALGAAFVENGVAYVNGLSRTAAANLLESLDCPVAISVAKSPKFFRRSDVAKAELRHELRAPN